MKFLSKFGNLNKEFLLSVVLLVCLTLPLILPLLLEGSLRTDDGDWMIIRFSGFVEAVRNGEIPVRWIARLNNGFGYPVTNFLYPAYLYLGIPLFLFTKSALASVEILFAGTLIASAVFCYLWLRRHATVIAAFLGALLYLYAPYHLYDYTTRGSLGELLALAVVPLVLYALDSRKKVITALSFGLLLLSHNTLAVLFTPLIFLYEYMVWRKARSQEQLFGYLFLGIGLSLFFWLPALYDLQYTAFFQTDVAIWKNYFSSLSLIGLPLLLLLPITGYLAFIKHEAKYRSPVAILFLLVAVFSVFLSTNSSTSLWTILPVQFVQFPFRFLSLFLVSCAYLFSILLSILSTRVQLLVGSIFLIGVLFLGKEYLIIINEPTKVESFYATNQATTTIKNEYMPLVAATLNADSMKDQVELSAGSLILKEFRTNTIAFQVTATQSGKGRVHQIYFPGWNVKVNDVSQSITYDKDGLMEFVYSEGSSDVLFAFSKTPIRLISEIVSLLSLVVLGIILVRRYFIKT